MTVKFYNSSLGFLDLGFLAASLEAALLAGESEGGKSSFLLISTNDAIVLTIRGDTGSEALSGGSPREISEIGIMPLLLSVHGRHQQNE